MANGHQHFIPRFSRAEPGSGSRECEDGGWRKHFYPRFGTIWRDLTRSSAEPTRIKDRAWMMAETPSSILHHQSSPRFPRVCQRTPIFRPRFCQGHQRARVSLTCPKLVELDIIVNTIFVLFRQVRRERRGSRTPTARCVFPIGRASSNQARTGSYGARGFEDGFQSGGGPPHSGTLARARGGIEVAIAPWSVGPDGSRTALPFLDSSPCPLCSEIR